MELFNERTANIDQRSAKWLFVWDVIKLFRPSIIRPIEGTYRLNQISMYGSYFKIGYRNLERNKWYSMVNIGGLALGMGVCLLICQYISFEMSFDSFHPEKENTFRVVQTYYRNGEHLSSGVYTGYALGVLAKERIPEIEKMVRVHPQQEGLVVVNEENDKIFQEDNIWYVDEGFSELFEFPLKYGNWESGLSSNHNVVLTNETAVRYFGNKNPVGKYLRVKGGTLSGDFIITGVLERLPLNTHMSFDILLPMDFLLKNWRLYREGDGWGEWKNFVTYLSLRKKADHELVQSKFDQSIVDHIGTKLIKSNEKLKTTFQPITEIHLESGFLKDIAVNNGDIKDVYIFGLIGVFILLIAWVNYVNLSTARAMSRSKEVGIRKSIGAHKSQLISQFMIESVLVNSVAAVLSIGIAWILMPLLSNMIGTDLQFGILFNMKFWVAFTTLILIGSTLSGLYPAFVLSSFKPMSVLKLSGFASSSRGNMRKSLIVFQFMAAIFLISGTYLVYKQVMYMKNETQRGDTEKILVLNGPRAILDLDEEQKKSRYQNFKNDLVSYHSVLSISSSGSVPCKPSNFSPNIRRLGQPEEMSRQGFVFFVDSEFSKTYDLKLIAGESLSEGDHWEKDGLIINEEAVKVFGLNTPEEAIGQKLLIGFEDEFLIKGVVRNFYWTSMKMAHQPHIYAPDDYPAFFSVKVNLSNVRETILHIENAYHKAFPEDPFQIYFLDGDFEKQYQSDLRFGNLFAALSILATFIACLGLFALVSYSSTLKMKEIGIRKMLGASMCNLMLLLSREYFVLLAIATFSATPIIFYWGKSWLDNYAFRTEIGSDTFIVPSLILVVISILTVSYRIFTTAYANPVESLRYE